MKHCAVAIFVKTPGLSSIKTRLAESIGSKGAAAFYTLACKATERIVRQLTDRCSSVVPYWAVSEQAGLLYPQWESFQCISQGDGDLAEKLFQVHDLLQEKYKHIIFIGADNPHLEVGILQQAVTYLTNDSQGDSTLPRAIIGPSEDGGFYLIGLGGVFSKKIWQGVGYGSTDACAQMTKHLAQVAHVKFLPTFFDIDTVMDLQKLGFFLLNAKNLFTEQEEILKWIQCQFRW